MNYIMMPLRDFANSFKSLKKLSVLCYLSMLIAVGIVLDLTSGIYITPEIKVTFSFLATAVCGALLGPVPAMMCGGLVDVLMWVIKPQGAYFPGYTLSGMLTGLIFGLFLYRAKGKLVWVLAPISKLVVNVFVNILLNTCWSVIFTGKAYMVLLGGRIIKNLAAWPIEAVLLSVIILFVSKNRRRLIR